MGKATIRGYRFPRHNAFPKGESKEEAASPPKKKANPASLRSAAPSKGRGSRGHSLLPMEGGAPKGRRLDGGSGMNWNIDSIGLFNIARYTASMPLLPSALPPKGEARRYIANDFLNLIALPQGGRLNRQRLRREYIGGDARRSQDKRIPVLNFPSIAHLPANDKHFSLRLKCRYRSPQPLISSCQSLHQSLSPLSHGRYGSRRGAGR